MPYGHARSSRLALLASRSPGSVRGILNNPVTGRGDRRARNPAPAGERGLTRLPEAPRCVPAQSPFTRRRVPRRRGAVALRRPPADARSSPRCPARGAGGPITHGGAAAGARPRPRQTGSSSCARRRNDAPLAGAECAVPGAPAPDRTLEQGVASRRRGAHRRGGVARPPARPGTYLAVVRATGLAPAHAEVFRAPGEESRTRRWPSRRRPRPKCASVARPDGRPVQARVVLLPTVGRGARLSRRPRPWRSGSRPQRTVPERRRGLDGLRPREPTLSPPRRWTPPRPPAARGVPRVEPLAISLEPLAHLRRRPRSLRPARGGAESVRGASRDHAASATSDAEGRYTLAALRAPTGSPPPREGAAGAGPVTVQAGATTEGSRWCSDARAP